MTSDAALRVERYGLAAEVLPGIDRVTYFGWRDGPNLLHVEGLERPVPTDGSYTFYGGCYTWVAPQKGPDASSPLGWLGSDGTKQDWPPDPAMDVGPVRPSAGSEGSISTTGPEHLNGLQELKSFTIIGPDTAELTYTLRNRGSATRVAGPWITTAVRPDDIMALWMPAGTEVWGWDQQSVDRFKSLLRTPAKGSATGWRLLDLSQAEWQGGIKVYIGLPRGGAGPSPGLRAVQIAVWCDEADVWLHRSLGPMSHAQAQALREAGEGPVAVYIQPATSADDGEQPAIIEAELYGPIAPLAPGDETSVTERWRIIPAEDADMRTLP